MQIPIGEERDFSGVIDLLEDVAFIWADETGKAPEKIEVPAEFRDLAEARRALLVEQIAETDDELTEKFLEGMEIKTEELHAALRRAVIHGKLTPAFCGSSLRNKGVQPLLNAVVDYLPSPLDIPPVRGLDPEGTKELMREARPDVPMSALAFKIVTDPDVGRLADLRVYSGKITKGSQVYNASKGRKERIGRLIRMYADHREDIEEVSAGDIAAVLGMKSTFTGDTLTDPANPIVLESIVFPEPVIFAAIEPKTSADQDRMGDALKKLGEEDPTFRVGTDENTGQTMIWGMGELHLEVLIDRMRREFKVQTNIGRPRVAYKESIRKSVPEVDFRYVKQTGGRGHFAHAVLAVEPAETGSGIEFTDKVRGGTVPSEFIPAVEQGVREAAEAGVLAGYPMTDISITLLDGSSHEVDSSKMAFKMAGSMGFKEGVNRAKPVLLEPVMKIEVVVPDEAVGDVTGDLSSRRASIGGLEQRGGNTQIVRATAPLSEMFGYATDLRSMTQGRGVFSMEFHHYEQVEKRVTESLLAGAF
jgi:elongation factor G